MHRAPITVIALVAMIVSGGCYHYTADIPGVLDTRSDGSTADASPPEVKDPELRREGVSAILSGDGVQADGAHVLVDERHFFAGVTALLPGAFLLTNESAKPELEAALGTDALREVRVSHQYSGFDIFLTVLVNIVPCVPLLLLPQPYTFQATGERIASSGQAPANRPVAPPVEVKPPVVEEAPPVEPTVDESKAEDSKAEDSKTEGSKTEDSNTEAPKTEAPKTEAPKTADAPKTETENEVVP